MRAGAFPVGRRLHGRADGQKGVFLANPERPADRRIRVQGKPFCLCPAHAEKILEEQAQKNNGKSDDDFASALAAVFGVSVLAVAAALVISALLGDNKGKKK